MKFQEGIFIDSIDSVTTKDGDFHYEKKIRQKSEEASSSREKLPERERNIFGLRRGKLEEVPERTTTSVPDNFTLLELTVNSVQTKKIKPNQFYGER